MRVKEEGEKADLKLNIQKMKIMPSVPITSWQTDGETVETYSPFPSQVRKLRWGGALSSFHSGCQGHWVGESHLQAEITSSTFVWSPFRKGLSHSVTQSQKAL